MLRLKSPLSVQLEITDACNNSCIHCYNYWRYLKTGPRVDKDSKCFPLSHFTHILETLIKLEVPNLTITGGEPFIRKDVLFELVRIAKHAGMIVGINTNGTMVNKEDVAILKNLRVDFFLVSLLGDSESVHNAIAHSDSYTLTLHAIEETVCQGIDTSINMVVSQYNYTRIKDTAKLVSKMGVKSFSATPVIACYLSKWHKDIRLNPEQVKQALDDLLWINEELGISVDVLEPLAYCMFSRDERSRFGRFLNHRSCSAGITEIAISPTGDIRPCIHADESAGNILSNGWDICWARLEEWASQDMLPQDCLSCDMVDFCGGGCRMAALDKNGNIKGKDPYMTQPITDFETMTTNHDHTVDFGDEDLILVSPKLLLREESFGGIAFSGKRYVFLKPSPFAFLREVFKKKTFTIRDLIVEFNLDSEEVREFIGILLTRDLLELAERRKRL